MQRDHQRLGHLSQQALMLAVDALRNDDNALLHQLGLADLDDKLCGELKTLNIGNLSCATDFRGNLLHVRFDVGQLKHFLRMANTKYMEDELINRAIRGGLRQPMLEELKGISRRDYANRRTRMGLPEHAKGRILSLEEEDELTVLKVWQQIKKEVDDELQRYVLLHERTGIALDRAWVVIKEMS